MANGTLLFYGGMLLAVLALLLGLAAAVILRVKHRRLSRKLDQEYGAAEQKRRNPS